jgi:hypothetical protein
MTVKELIEQLEKQPQDRIVVIRSYESGCDKAVSLEVVLVEEDSEHSWWDGSYAYIYNEVDRTDKTIEAVQIIGG